MPTDPHACVTFKPGEYYYRVRYQRARSRAQRDELFYSLARDHQQLRNWIRDTFGVNPPKFEFTSMEAHDKPWIRMYPPLRLCASDPKADSVRLMAEDYRGAGSA